MMMSGKKLNDLLNYSPVLILYQLNFHYLSYSCNCRYCLYAVLILIKSIKNSLILNEVICFVFLILSFVYVNIS
jgi:hypothetical protein